MQVYVTVWQAAPETRIALEKLRATWHGVFADAVLASVARASQARSAAVAAVTAWSVELVSTSAEATLLAACLLLGVDSEEESFGVLQVVVFSRAFTN